MKRKRTGKRGCSAFFLSCSLLLLAAAAVIAIRPLLDTRHRVVIDPGHGGADGGASGVVQEAEMTEQTAFLLAELLQEDGRFRVWVTRDRGDGASLTDRCRTAVLHRAELMLSVHGNSAGDTSASGFECYPTPPGRERHEESLRFAGLLAARMAEAGAGLRGTEGIRYAYYLSDGTKQLVDGSDDRIREEESFAVVEHAGCPSVLAEQCFVTNQEDTERFGSGEGCQRTARQYYLAVLDFFGEEENPEP